MKSPDRIPLRSLLGPENGACSARMKELAARIANGALFVYPTETIYGIGGCFGVPGVGEKIFLAKKRATGSPLILIAPERASFDALSLIFPPAAEALSRAFWPGMLTLVLPSSRSNGPGGIGVRVSKHPFIKALFKYCNLPIYSTSANMSGEPYVNDTDLIYGQFSDAVDFMVDAGPLPDSPPSTVVKVGEDNTVTVLREGAISAAKIAAITLA